MNHTFILVFACFFLFTVTSFAQTKPALYKIDADSANHYMQNREYAKALVSFKRSFKKGNTDLYDYYNAGCCASLTQKHDEAFSLLTKSIQQGYLDDPWILKDSDLEPLRTDKRWPQLMKEFKKAQDAIAKKFTKIKTLDPSLLIPFKQNGRWGYVNKNTLAVVVKPEFQELEFMNACTYAYYKDRCRLKISSAGEIMEVIYPLRDEEVSVAVEADDDRGPKIVSSTNGFKGFTMDEKNQIVTFSDIYDTDCDYCEKIAGPYRINNTFYTLVKKAGHYGLIDQEGDTLPHFGFVHKELVRNYKSNGQSIWFYFKDDNDNNGFMNEAGEVKLYNELIGSLYSVFNRFQLNVQQNKDASGVLDLGAMEWVIKPQPLKITGIDFTIKGECVPYFYQVSRDQIIDRYFLTTEGDSAYYMDRDLRVYRPKL
ncbi:MAG: hypothetical protein C0490_18840 [Marivirga sp.]|nr:hypothetical protein [Marivirga sp.]